MYFCIFGRDQIPALGPKLNGFRNTVLKYLLGEYTMEMHIQQQRLLMPFFRSPCEGLDALAIPTPTSIQAWLRLHHLGPCTVHNY